MSSESHRQTKVQYIEMYFSLFIAMHFYIFAFCRKSFSRHLQHLTLRNFLDRHARLGITHSLLWHQPLRRFQDRTLDSDDMVAVHELSERMRRMMAIAEDVLDDSLDRFVFRRVRYHKTASSTSNGDNERTFSGRHPPDPRQTGYETYEARPQHSAQHRSHTNSYSSDKSPRRPENIRYTCRKYCTGSKRDIVDSDYEEEYQGHRVRRVSPDRPAQATGRPTRSHHWRKTSLSRTTYYHYESTPLPQESPGPRSQSDYNEQYYQPQPSSSESGSEAREHRRGLKHTTFGRRPDRREHRRDAESHHYRDEHSFSRGFSAAAEESGRA